MTFSCFKNYNVRKLGYEELKKGVKIMVSGLGANVLDYIVSFFASLASMITVDFLVYGIAALFGVFLIYGIVRVLRSYEIHSLRAIKSINKYLIKNPHVKDSNLIEFNGQMRKLPTRMRERWQLYMLERDGGPSKYMTGEHCVERPLRYSSITNFLKQFKYAITVVAVLGFLLVAGFLSGQSITDTLASVLLRVSVLPLCFILLCSLFSVIVQARYHYITTDLADNFTIFMRNVDKATLTMPDYVDYELLFTKKEIRDGIPVLREYLEKRALEEQRLIEEAKKNAVEYSPYKFDDLGVNGSLLLERAVHESEEFLLTRIRLQNEITDLNKDMERSKRGFEDIEKEAQRKLQTIRENLERLKKQADESTNRIEVNYIRKQEAEEIKKQSFIERDLEEYRKRADEEQKNITVEIQRRKETIDTQRSGIEDALKAEYNTFATKVYEELNKKMAEDQAEIVQTYEDAIAAYKAKLKEIAADADRKDSMIEARNLEIDNLRMNGKTGQYSAPAVSVSDGGLGNDGYNASHELYTEETGENLINSNLEETKGEEFIDYSQYYDENGNLIDYSATAENATEYAYDDYSQYYDADGNLIDYSQYYDENGNYIEPKAVVEEPVRLEQKVEEPVVEKPVVAESKEVVPVVKEEKPVKAAAKPKAATKAKTTTTTAKKTTTTRLSTSKKKSMPSTTGRRLTTNKVPGATKTSVTKSNMDAATKAKVNANPKIATELEDLMKLQRAIEKESSNLVKQQQELRSQINTTLKDIDADTSITKSDRNKYLKQIKLLIEDLKVQAQNAKERGAPKTEQNAINKSIMDLLNAIAKYSAEK